MTSQGRSERKAGRLGPLGTIGLLFVAIIAVTAVFQNIAGPGAKPPTPEQLAAQQGAAARAEPQRALSLDYEWGTGGFGAVMLLSGKIASTADFAIKDPMIRCTLIAPSGTRIGRVVQTLYRPIPAKGTIRFRRFNMGLMGTSQAARADCAVISATAFD